VSRNNAFEAFLLEFTNGFKQTVLNIEERNREIYELIYGNTDLAEQIIDFYARKVVLRGCPKTEGATPRYIWSHRPPAPGAPCDGRLHAALSRQAASGRGWAAATASTAGVGGRGANSLRARSSRASSLSLTTSGRSSINMCPAPGTSTNSAAETAAAMAAEW
jgi:hypothetical protein